jgi:hypothetical protein
MSTHSIIALQLTNGQIVSAYCHFDGYPSHNGRILLENYKTFEQVRKLVTGGDMSSLGEKSEKVAGHSYVTPVEGYTVYYGRDRNETEVGAKTHKDREAFEDYASESPGEYIYLFANNKWYWDRDARFLKMLIPKHCRK